MGAGSTSPALTLTRRRSPRRLVALARMGMGVYWLYEQHWKLPPDFGLHQPRGLMFSFQQSVQHPTLALYASFLQGVVIPHFHLFGWLVFLAETVIGLLLSLGLFTRLAALLGLLEAVNIFVSQASTPEGAAIYVAILAANIFVLVTPGNRVWSLDQRLLPGVARLSQRHPRLAGTMRLAMGLVATPPPAPPLRGEGKA